MPRLSRFWRADTSRRTRSPFSSSVLWMAFLSASAGCGVEPSSSAGEAPRPAARASALTNALPLPATCADVRAAFPSAPDGEYLLYVQGDAARAWLAWCQDMAGTPTEYLSLAPLEGPANYSEYAAGGSSPGSTVRTTYGRLRVDPSTLALQTSDQRFTASAGQLTRQGTPVTSMPFASATSCSPALASTGSIDLRGTPFALSDGQLAVGGSSASSFLADPLRQTFRLVGSATCGVTASLGGAANAYNQKGGALKLKFAPPAALPSTCAQVRQTLPVAGDGPYTLYAGHEPGKPWMAWCHDMAGTPTEYLPLALTGPDANYSQYTAGGTSPGTTVRTVFTRLRIDPVSFTVNTADQRFASSSGQLHPAGSSGDGVTSMPYASAMDCVADWSATGRASIDLRGTPFALVPHQLATTGDNASMGNTLYGTQNQTAQLTGGGRCGWTSLAGSSNPSNQRGGSLRLQYLGPAVLPVDPPATCAQVRQKSSLAGDGLYPLFVGKDVAKPWLAWCHDMAGTPAEYLPLARTGQDVNFSQYTAGGTSSGTTVRTLYSMLRIDPTSFVVNTSDQRFSSSSGQLTHAGDRNRVVTSMPFATTLDCAGGRAPGRASVDLRGTSFSVLPNQFSTAGTSTASSTAYGAQNRTVQLQAGGHCVWTSLNGASLPINQNGGSLRLQYTPPPPQAAPVLASTCAQVRQTLTGASDGLYLLFAGGEATRPWTAWCQDMAGTPLEYLPLPNPTANVSEFLASGSALGDSVRTTYSRLRIDPSTLAIQTADQRFASSTGQLTFAGEQVTSMPLGSTLGCDALGHTGLGSIDLRGTPFALVAGQFSAADGSAAEATLGDGNQTLRLQDGVPACGWVAPSASVQPLNQTGSPLTLQHVTAFLPATCAQVRQQFPRAADGHYTLYVGGDASKPWKAWCQDMSSTPLEYLSLAPLGASANFSEYLAGGLASGSTVRTVYSRLRLDPASLRVNTADQRFASSSGQLSSGGTQVTAMPYATAMNCNLSGATGQGSIDLRGTPFSLQVSQLAQGGSLTRGSAVSSHLGQTVQLQGGGSCGWSSLRGLSHPVNQSGGALQLTYGALSN